MKISYNWLKDFVAVNIDPHLLADKLSLTGFEVEEVEERRLDFPNVVVGKILEIAKHPNADKLTLCKVDVGDEMLNVICGAPNVRENQVVPVAKVGAILPGGLKIKRTKIRGEESAGMICSEQEMGMADSSDGIWELPADLPIGVPLDRALNFDTDFVFDVAVTPNRPDGLSHIGIAREVAAILDLPFRKPEPEFTELPEKTTDVTSVEIKCPDSCPRYAARIIRNVTIAPSPEWMARRLKAVGMRPINNVVDITNYVLMETGHPLHAFDYDLLDGGRIVVREALDGEYFVTLDEKGHELKAGTVLICDASNPVALGGIMGGLNSEVSDKTKTILLESAYFKPENIQRSLRYLGISSEASQRFERGADPNGVIYAQARATQLMIELAGGETYQGAVDEYPRKIYPVEIPLKYNQINTLLGTHLSDDEINGILHKIELRVEDARAIIPTFRPDLERVADIAEEVARLYGLDNIAAAEKTEIHYDYSVNTFDRFVDWLRDILTGMGIQEVISSSMINKKTWDELTGEEIYPILNPISHDMSGLRNNLPLSLMSVVQWNVNRKIKDLRIFEINRVFNHPGSLKKLPGEELHLAIAITGNRERQLWYSGRQPVDFYDIKGIVETLLDKISLDNTEFISYDDFVVEGHSLGVVKDGKKIGYLGLVKGETQDHFDLENPVYVAGFNVHLLYELSRSQKKYEPVPRIPWVERDLAILVDEKLEVENLIRAIKSADVKYLRDVSVFDIYTGKQVEAGQKSVALRFIFQSMERTLTETEVTELLDSIIKIIQGKFKIKFRPS